MVSVFIWWDGDKFWLLNYQRHRANGPAVSRANGSCGWWWHGKQISEYEHMMLAELEIVNG